MNKSSSFVDLISRFTEDVVSYRDLEQKLSKSESSGIPLRVKFGIDPTFTDVHIGHAVPIRLLRLFQDAGHLPVLILGDSTARLGDPTGRNEQRPPLSEDEVESNATTYLKQIAKVLDLSEHRCEVRRNSEWFGSWDFFDALKLLGKGTVARLMERDDFQKRAQKNLPIYLHETIYPLMQGQDSVEVQADIELGGTDQLFNLHMGRQLQERAGQSPQVCITTPLLLGTDGRKMSKTYGNHVALNAPAKDVFGKVMSIPDETMAAWYSLGTPLGDDEIKALLAGHPRDAKVRLAKEICTWIHDEKSADAAADAFQNQFRDKKLPTDIPSTTLTEKSWPLPSLLKELGLCASTSEARRLLQGGGVRVNEKVLSDPQEIIALSSEPLLIQVGKRKFCRVTSP